MEAGVALANVCMLVRNSVVHDMRVLREALALQAAGHDVTVVGILIGSPIPPTFERFKGIRIVRVPWRSRHYRGIAMRRAVALILKLGMAGVTVIVAWQWHFLKVSVLSVIQSPLFGVTIALVAVGLALYRMVDRAVSDIAIHVQRSRGHAAIENGHSRPLPSPRWRERVWARAHRSLRLLSRVRRSSSPLGRAERFLQEIVATRRALRTVTRPYAHAIRDLKPDVIHAHELDGLELSVRGNRSVRVPIVFDAHEIYQDRAQVGRATSLYARWALRRLQSKCDAFVTVSDRIARFYHDSCPRLPAATVVRNASEMKDPQGYDGRLHDHAGLPQTQRIILFQGGLTPHRGLIPLVDAAARIPSEWTVVFMGWGSLEEEIRERAGALVAQDANRTVPSIAFVPPVDPFELHDWTKGATVGMIPYEDVSLNHHLSTPNKLWEYPNAGVPMIVSPLPELIEAVEGYKMGWVLSAPVSAESIAEVVSNITEEDIARARAGCRRFIEEDNWSIYSQRLVDLYEQLLSDRR